MPIYNVPGRERRAEVHRSRSSPTSSSARSRSGTTRHIAKENAGVQLPTTDIVVVHRSEGSGTTYIFADFLAKVSPEWKSKVGVNNSVNWPTGIGSKGSDGVTGQVKSTPGAIGYTELTYALTNKIAYGDRAELGRQIRQGDRPSRSPRRPMPQRSRCRPISACRSPMRRAKGHIRSRRSPGCCSTRTRPDKAQAKVMVGFLTWALQDGQKFAPEMGYAPLPKAVVDLELKALANDQDAVDGQTPLQRPSRRARCSASGRASSPPSFVIGVLAIGVELYRQSRLSIQEFGWQFWQTDTWDPVAGEFGARPFIWGTLYSSILAIAISTPIALGIAIYISELAPDWARAPLVFLTELLAAIPSIVYGLWGVFVLVPAVRQLEAATPALA